LVLEPIGSKYAKRKDLFIVCITETPSIDLCRYTTNSTLLHSTVSSPPTDYRARALSTSTGTYTKSLPLFTSQEFHALISTAHSLNVRIAAHCVNPSTIKTLLSAGIDTLEHGTEMTEELLGVIKERGVVWCPTLAAYYSYHHPGSKKWDSVKMVLRKAGEMGVRVATGGDTGVFPHGENALEMQLIDWAYSGKRSSAPRPGLRGSALGGCIGIQRRERRSWRGIRLKVKVSGRTK
jgi:hypothetical protein